MVYSCCVCGCTKRFVKDNLFRFPKDENIKKQWEKSIGQYFVSTKYSRVCSKHFEPRCFLVNEETGRKWLRPDVVPTLYIVPRHHTKKVESRKEKNKYEKYLASLSSQLSEQVESRKEKNKYEKCLASLSSHLSEQVEPREETNKSEECSESHPTEQVEPKKERNMSEECSASHPAEQVKPRKERNLSEECSASHPAEQVEPRKEINMSEAYAASNFPRLVYKSQGNRYSCLGDSTEEDMNSPEKSQKVLPLTKMLEDENQKLKKKYRSPAKKVVALEDVLRQMKKARSGTFGSFLESLNIDVKEVKDQSPQEEQDNIPVEPTIRIKEEPTDNYSTPSTSNGTSGEEFILPHIDIPWTTTSPVVEPQLTLSVASLNSPIIPEPSDGEPLEKKLRTDSSNITIASVSTLASLSTVPSNHTAVKPQSAAINLENISTPGSSKELQKYQFDSFAHYVATKLNSLDPISSSCAQKDIKNIILEAEMGKYLNQTQDIKPSIEPHSF